MDLTSFTNVSSFLGILAPVFVLLGFVWVWARTQSRHVPMYRLWRLLHGSQPINDPEVSSFIEEQTSLMSFRFLTGVQVKTLAGAHQLIQWAKLHDVEIQAIDWCGNYFDPDLRQVRTDKLPSAWLQNLKVSLTFLVLLTTAGMSMGIATNDALLKLKATNHWFLLNAEKAKVVWPFHAEPLKKSDCQAKSNDIALRTSFSELEVSTLCTLLMAPATPDSIQEIVFTQRLAFAFGAIVFAVLTWILYWECMKRVAAKALQKRNLNPDITGGQISLKFDEN